jgi:hypothetical protein
MQAARRLIVARDCNQPGLACQTGWLENDKGHKILAVPVSKDALPFDASQLQHYS